MSFQESAESWRSRIQVRGVKSPVLVVVCVVALLILIFVLFNVWNMIQASSFEISSNSIPAQNPLDSEGNLSQDDLSGSSEDADTTEGSAEGTLAGADVELAVHVGGAVMSPGVYHLAEGMRVEDAVVAAGGFSDEAARDSVNLARMVIDGEQILVPTLEEIAAGLVPQQSEIPGAAAGGDALRAGSGSEAEKVNINTASASELTSLSGIGEVTAQKIIDERNTSGPFTSPKDIMRVSGIGEKKYAQIAESICV